MAAWAPAQLMSRIRLHFPSPADGAGGGGERAIAEKDTLGIQGPAGLRGPPGGPAKPKEAESGWPGGGE